MKVYVASSWRNSEQPQVVAALRRVGYSVYDFRNPRTGDDGFHWSEIDPDWQEWTPERYRQCLDHPLANSGYNSDMSAMERTDVFVGVQPFGRSASMEMGWAAGQGKKTILLLSSGEPELMVKMFDFICVSMDEVISSIATVEVKP